MQLMAERPLDELVEEHIFGGEPYVFHESPNDYQLLREDLCASLSIETKNMTIVGSAKTGFSMSPEAFGTPFQDSSDVDVVVIDADRFDQLWFTLLRWDHGITLNRFLSGWRQRRREDVYWGRFFTGEPLPRFRGKDLVTFREVANQWFSAFQSVGLRHATLSARKFSGRLYRTWDHARTYHTGSLRDCYLTNRREAGAT